MMINRTLPIDNTLIQTNKSALLPAVFGIRITEGADIREVWDNTVVLYTLPYLQCVKTLR